MIWGLPIGLYLYSGFSHQFWLWVIFNLAKFLHFRNSAATSIEITVYNRQHLVKPSLIARGNMQTPVKVFRGNSGRGFRRGMAHIFVGLSRAGGHRRLVYMFQWTWRSSAAVFLSRLWPSAWLCSSFCCFSPTSTSKVNWNKQTNKQTCSMLASF